MQARPSFAPHPARDPVPRPGAVTVLAVLVVLVVLAMGGLLFVLLAGDAAAAAELRPTALRGGAAPGRVVDWRAAPWQWRRVPVAGAAAGDALLAVAVDPRRPGRAAVGHGGGVSLSRAGEPFRFAARVEGVTDLAFASDGSLWIASLGGLWRLSPDGRLAEQSPAPGDESRRVHRVHAGASLVVAATEAGAWVSADGVVWTRLADGLPRGPVTAVRLAGAGDEAPLLRVVVGRELWEVRLLRADGRVAPASARRIEIAGAPTGEAPLDLWSDATGREIAVVYARFLAVREAGDRFRILRPVLPPGASASRVVVGTGRVWLATDQGLLHAADWDGPWRRSEAPAGSATVRALAASAGGDTLLAASPFGLLRGAPVVRAAADPEGDASPVDPRLASFEAAARDPDIRGVHAASLRYLGLRTEHMRALRDGLAVRGWIPSLSLRLAAARDRSWGTDDDQSFVSGETRYLRDRDEGRSLDLEASLVMTWDLPTLAFDPDAVDLSREHRQVVSLRDNVLDEINQLYFERRGLLEKLRTAPEGMPAAEREAMALRAAELAAGLDAWTGGWFSSSERAAPWHRRNAKKVE